VDESLNLHQAELLILMSENCFFTCMVSCTERFLHFETLKILGAIDENLGSYQTVATLKRLRSDSLLGVSVSTHTLSKSTHLN
jgi:hypothetical protein